MSLSTHSKFYFNYEIDQDNNALDFDEGSGEVQATLNVGSYSLTDFVSEISRALNDVSTLDYTVSVNRDTRIITIAGSGTFSLLVSTGSRSGTSCFSTIGFTGADRTSAATYDADQASGEVYSTQFILQDHISTSHSVGASDGSVNKSASGRVEVIKFGEERFLKCNFKYLTNRTMPTAYLIRNRPTGIDDFINFMEFLITKAPIEYMPDENVSSTFETLILESTPDDKNGIKFELKEQYAKGLPGFFESGKVVFRKVD